jgi:hypothetical protein
MVFVGGPRAPTRAFRTDDAQPGSWTAAVKLPTNGRVAEVHCAPAIKEASARHGPSPAADGVFTDRLINSPG